MSAAVKHLTRKMAEAQAEFDKANAAAKKAAQLREKCSEQVWDVRNELDAALNADIQKAMGKLVPEGATKSGVPV